MKRGLSFLLFVSLTLAYLSTQAQTYTWEYFQDAGNPGGINTESDAPGQNAWIDILEGPTSANDWSSTVEIPFDFYFYNTLVTHLKASANGVVTFDTLASTLSDNNFSLPSDSLASPSIACFWDEFTASAPTGSGDDIRYKVLGSAPNRQLWIKWYSFEMGDPTISFAYNAAVLEEGTNNVYVVDLYSTTSTTATSSMLSTVGVQGSSTQFTQAGGGFVNLSGNSSSNTNNDYYMFIPLDSLDVAITQVTSPSGSLCPGSYDVDIELQNVGVTFIDSVTVSYTVNGSVPVTQTFTGLNLDTLETTTVTIGNFTFAAATLYDVDIYASDVNGVADDDQTNDTLSFIDLQTGLSGNYTIDGATATGGTNYQTFSDAADALNEFGVCGAVVFEVEPGTYSENVYLGEISGASATNTITFDGQDATQAKLVYDGSVVEPTWQMEGTDHVTIKNLTLQNTKTTADAWNIHLSNVADSNTIDSCRFILPVATTSDVQHIVASNSLTFETSSGNNANYLTVKNSYFRGGETGVHIEGNGTNNWTTGYLIENNTFRQLADEAFDCDDIQEVALIGNDVDSVTISGADGFYLLDVNDYQIVGNNIVVDDWGVYVLDGNDGFTPTTASTVINNMVVSTSGDDAIYLNDFESTLVYHNSLVGGPGLHINDQVGVDIRNNIFVGDNDVAFDSDDALTANDSLNYNVYGGNGTNLATVVSSSYATLTAWQTATPAYNGNSVEGTPTFVGPTDLHALDNTANDVGDNSVGVLVDIDGDSRPAATIVDIGADEYTPVNNDMSSILIVSPTGQICEDSLVMVEVVIQNNGLNNQDSIPYEIVLSGTSTATWFDTVYNVASFASDTVMLGPINVFGFGNSLLSVYSTLTTDENTSNDTISDSLMIIDLPSTLTTVSAAVCAPGDSAMVYATDADSGYVVTWYDDMALTSIVGTGDTFTTTTTGMYYATQTFIDKGQVGPLDNSIGGGGNYTSFTSDGLNFTVYDEVTIDSVTVYPNGAGDVYVLLKDAGGSTLQSTNVTVSGDTVTIPVGFTVTPGDYQLTSSTSTSTGGLFRNSSGAVYPYSHPAVDITGPVNNLSGYYYFFYDWKITSSGCESEASMAEVFLDSTDVELPADETICQEDDLFIEPIELGFTYASYLWQDGSTDTAYTATTAGTVSVTVTSAFGCEFSDEMVIDTFPEPQVSIGNDTSFCEDAEFEVTFDAGPGFTQYLWSNAGQTQTITVDYFGSFTVSVTDNNGCEGTSTAEIIALPLPLVDAGEDTTICEDSTYVLPVAGGTLTTVWTDENGNTVTEATAAGEYYIEVTDENGCSNRDTLVVSTKECINGILSIDGNEYSIFPNPANEFVTVQLEEAAGDMNVKLYDAIGKVVYARSISNSNQFTIDVSGLAHGYYMLELSTDKSQSMSRLIVQ